MVSENTESTSFVSAQAFIYLLIAEEVLEIAHQFINFYDLNSSNKKQDNVYIDEYGFFS